MTLDELIEALSKPTTQLEIEALVKLSALRREMQQALEALDNVADKGELCDAAITALRMELGTWQQDGTTASVKTTTPSSDAGSQNGSAQDNS